MLLEVLLVGLDHTIEPRQKLLRAVVRVEDDLHTTSSQSIIPTTQSGWNHPQSAYMISNFFKGELTWQEVFILVPHSLALLTNSMQHATSATEHKNATSHRSNITNPSPSPIRGGQGAHRNAVRFRNEAGMVCALHPRSSVSFMNSRSSLHLALSARSLTPPPECFMHLWRWRTTSPPHETTLYPLPSPCFRDAPKRIKSA